MHFKLVTSPEIFIQGDHSSSETRKSPVSFSLSEVELQFVNHVSNKVKSESRSLFLREIVLLSAYRLYVYEHETYASFKQSMIDRIEADYFEILKGESPLPDGLVIPDKMKIDFAARNGKSVITESEKKVPGDVMRVIDEIGDIDLGKYVVQSRKPDVVTINFPDDPKENPVKFLEHHRNWFGNIEAIQKAPSIGHMIDEVAKHQNPKMYEYIFPNFETQQEYIEIRRKLDEGK